MEANSEDKLINSVYDDMDSEGRLILDFQARLNFQGNFVELSEENQHPDNTSDEEVEEEEEEEEEEEDDDDEEFTFMNGGELPSPVAAEDAFSNGQIKAVFPLFNQQLLFSNDDSNPLIENLPVRKVFVETSAENTPATSSSSSTSSSTGDDEIAGPYCEWSNRKAVEASEQACKKSNSTGFSKIWRLKEFIGRTNSDGRDAFVIVNSDQLRQHTAKKKKPAKAIGSEEEEEESAGRKTSTSTSTTRNVKGGKSKTTSLSAHEVYLRNKKKDGERRRPTYLPYRPELVGFFTTLNTGLTKNVHPY